MPATVIVGSSFSVPTLRRLIELLYESARVSCCNKQSQTPWLHCGPAGLCSASSGTQVPSHVCLCHLRGLWFSDIEWAPESPEEGLFRTDHCAPRPEFLIQ